MSDLVIVTPPEVTALTTLERAKSESEIFDDANDDLLTAKILEATSDIVVRCAPTFRRETVTETFYREDICFGDGSIILREYPVVSISEILVDGDVLDSTLYRVNKENGILYRIGQFSFCYGWLGCQSVAVTYTAGYLLPGQVGRDLPYSIEGACIDLIRSFWSSRDRDPNVKSEEAPGVFRFEYWVGAIGAAGELPPGVMSKIGPYRKVSAR